MKWAPLLRQIPREARGSRGRWLVFLLALGVGVGAVVGVGGLAEGLRRGLRAEGRSLLAADLAIESRRPLPPEIAGWLSQEGLVTADLREMLTLAAGAESGRSVLAELKAVGEGYPFYGAVELSPPGALSGTLAPGTAAAAPALLDRLGLRIGDAVLIGGESFRVAAAVRSEPDRIVGAFTLGPRLFVSLEGLARTDLEQLGSRIRYRTLVRLPEDRQDDLGALVEALQERLPQDGRYRVATYRQAQPSVRRGLRRVERYLGLVALLSLLAGGIGVAQTVRSWVAGRLDAIAVLKCLGYRPREILALYLVQAGLLGLVGSAVGVLVGLGLQLVAMKALAASLPVGVFRLWQPWTLTRGLALGVGVALLFALPPLLTARRVPPVRVLRHDAEPLPPTRLARGLLWIGSAAAIFLAATWQAGSLELAGRFLALLTVAVAALAAAAAGLTRFASRPRRIARLWLRQAMAALGRPGTDTLAAVVAIGLGVLLLLGLFQVERHLSSELGREVPVDAPTAFLIDIQPDQWPGVQRLFGEVGATEVDSVPVVMARLSAIDGRGAEALRAERGRGGRWALSREHRLTYLERLPEDNRVVAGALWSDPQRGEVSVEEEFASDLGVGLGSRLTFDIQGVAVELSVTSLRTVEWESFGINFFLIVEPGILEEAPQHRIAAARLPGDGEQRLQDGLAAAFPNVTMIRIRDVLDRVAAVLQRLGLGVRLLGWVTVAAGVVLLVGAVAASSVRRGLEVALLKTLGMTRRQVLAAFAAEYAILGLVAGLIGASGAGLLAWFVVTRRMEMAWDPEIAHFLLAWMATAAAAVGAGLVGSWRPLQKRPIEVLRSAE